MPKNSEKKLSIIQSIDRRVSLDEIAAFHGMTFDELLDTLESIVNAGLKLNIDYYLKDKMDDYLLDDIYQYLMESETGDVDEAIEELGDDVAPEDVRLVKIKFMSEKAN